MESVPVGLEPLHGFRDYWHPNEVFWRAAGKGLIVLILSGQCRYEHPPSIKQQMVNLVANPPQTAETAHCTSEWTDRECPDVLCLFDVDGTLSPSRKTASPEMIELLKRLKQKCVIGYVGGSDLAKQKEQLGEDAATALFDFGFSENGATAFKNGQQIGNESFIGFLGEEKYKKLVNFLLHYIADLDIPVKRGCFIEFRNAMINVSPIGRNCSYQERLDFEAYDKQHSIRAKMVEALQRAFPEYGLKYSIGGQISIDAFPIGWDKTFCLRHVKGAGFREIHFFGDKTAEGGNDYEIFHHPSVLGHTVTDPSDTMRQLNSLFFKH